jgi:integrase
MRLTDVGLRNLPLPAKGQKTYFDDALPGFGCRVSQGGSRSFVVQHGADRQLVTIGRYPVISLAAARAEARRILAERVLGKHRPDSIVAEEAISLFLNECARKNKPRTCADYKRLLARHFDFGRRKLAEITPQDINRRLDRLAATPSEQSHALQAAKIFFTWAHRKHYVTESPCDRMQVLKGRPRDRVLSNVELTAVWNAAADYPFGPIVRLCILTGQRRGEIGSLRWDYIEGDIITLPASLTKNNRVHSFPVGPTGRKLLTSLPRLNEHVFPASRGDGMFNGWNKCKQDLDKTCGVTGWTLHDLRRTFATNLAALGIAPHVVERLLNHSSGTISGVAAIYNKFQYMDEMRAAITLWEERLASLLAQHAPAKLPRP